MGPMTRESKRIASAFRLIRQLRGSSPGIEVEASDGSVYVVRRPHTTQGDSQAAKNALGHSVYESLGLPVPGWTSIAISDAFIDAHPEMWLEFDQETCKPTGGLRFGMCCDSHSIREAYEILPTTWFGRVGNRRAFWGALVADVWLNKLDNRHVLFVQDGHSHRFSALFIQHGNISLCERSDLELAIRRCLYFNPLVYPNETMLTDLAFWLNRFARQGERAVARALAILPNEWLTAESSHIADRLVHQLPSLRERVFPHIFRWLRPPSPQSHRQRRFRGGRADTTENYHHMVKDYMPSEQPITSGKQYA